MLSVILIVVMVFIFNNILDDVKRFFKALDEEAEEVTEEEMERKEKERKIKAISENLAKLTENN